MTSHLSSEDQLAVLDGTLSADRLAHLSGCTTCQDAVARMQAVVDVVRSDEIPEPSPLFWEHFSARVRTATAAESVAEPPRVGWRVWVTVASAVMACALVLIVRGGPRVPNEPVSPTAQIAVGGARRAPAETAEAEPLAAVMQMASSLSSDDLRGVVSAAGAEMPLVEDLNPAERAAFVRLLHAEMEKVQ